MVYMLTFYILDADFLFVRQQAKDLSTAGK